MKVINISRFFAMELVPDLMRLFRIKMIDPPVEKFFTKIAHGIVKQRRNSVAEHNDIVQVSGVRCQVSTVRCQLSGVSCQLSAVS